MSTHAAPLPRRSGLASRRAPAAVKKPVPFENDSTTSAAAADTPVAAANGNASKPNSASLAPGERTVKKLRLSKALTIPEGTTVSDACRRMGVRRVDSVLLTDANGLLSGIVTDKDIATRVIAEGLRPQQTPASKIMTRNPNFVMSDTLAIEALQKMVQGSWSHWTAESVTHYLDCRKRQPVVKKREESLCSGDAATQTRRGKAQVLLIGIRRQVDAEGSWRVFSLWVMGGVVALGGGVAYVEFYDVQRGRIKEHQDQRTTDPKPFSGRDSADATQIPLNRWNKTDEAKGKFRHLPVVENGEVIAMLDITKCMYDAISKMEKAAEQGSAIAAAVEGVERQWGNNLSAPYAFIETLRERMFKPTLSTIVTEHSKVVLVSPSDPVSVATKKMREFRVNSVIIPTGSGVHGILTSKDVLMRVVAQNLSPELTPVEKVMTLNPECATLDTTILDALHIMHDGKFLHVPVLDSDGHIVACLDVLQLTHAAISMVDGGAEAANDMANTMMQNFWDSALTLEPSDEDEFSSLITSEYTESGKYKYPPHAGNSFSFKVEDQKGRIHRFSCGQSERFVSTFLVDTENLDALVSSIMQRIGHDHDTDKVQLLYEDDEGDKVLLTTDDDLVAAINHARSDGQKVLRLHIDDPKMKKEATKLDLAEAQRGSLATLQRGILTGTVVLASVGIMVYLKRSNS
ncbi:hypothetical protein ZIOFF_020612 [Zingiber officinale]|uniref:CBS domain-containing protein CBSCBSPB3 n=1 Tax=Zingiber officinale TaxID=94328 RepID=A0A8J5LFW7_ZINOF|nr:hypothetical protein ZIOFF_020612 [Zingiber officinale]